MQFQLPIQIKSPERKLNYRDKILLAGSCFTEHIGNSLSDLKYTALQNPNGILFDPASVCRSLISYIQNKQYKAADLFLLNEIWISWQHHSRFSNINKEECLKNINQSQNTAHEFLKKTDWIIITLGSSFSYRLTNLTPSPSPEGEGSGVANCHRAPANWFSKHLMEIEETISQLENCCLQLREFNPKLNIVFTVSPVRHVRDGVIENNRSKARLLESVHHLVNKYETLHYFPAYEIVIDVLRDYRFYDIDLIHPNYMATEFVLEKFAETFIDDESTKIMIEVKKIITARKHKAFQPATHAHKEFLRLHADKTIALMNQYPLLDLKEELRYFISSAETL